MLMKPSEMADLPKQRIDDAELRAQQLLGIKTFNQGKRPRAAVSHYCD